MFYPVTIAIIFLTTTSISTWKKKKVLSPKCVSIFLYKSDKKTHFLNKPTNEGKVHFDCNIAGM